MIARTPLRGVCTSLIVAVMLVSGCAKKNPPQGEAANDHRDPEPSDPNSQPKIGVDPAERGATDENERVAPPPRPVQPSAKGELDKRIAQLQHPDPRERCEAAKALGEIGASAHPAIQALVPLLNDADPEVKTQAANAIVAVGRTKASGLVDFSATWCGPCRTMKPIVERLKEEGLPVLLVDIDKYPRLAAQFKIEVVPTFVLIRRDKEFSRTTGVTSENKLRGMVKQLVKPGAARPPLELKDSAAQAQVMALLLSLTGEDEWTKFLAEEEVKSRGLQASSVLADVIRGKYPDRIRMGAVRGLQTIYRDHVVPAEAITLLKERAGNAEESIDIRGYASVALHKLKISDPRLGPALKAALEKGTVPELRELAAESLGELQVVEAIPALTKALDDESPSIQKTATKALRMMGGHAGNAVPRLLKIYAKDPESDVGEEIKEALQEIVPTAMDVAPALIDAMRSNQQPVRLLAVELLNSVDDPQPAAASLRMLLNDEDAGIRIRAATALQRLGQADAKVLKVLVASLDEEKENFEASEALRAEGRKIEMLLVDKVVDPKSTTEQRLRVIRIFMGIHQPRKAALSALTKALDSEVPDVSACSALVLSWRSPEDPALIKPLRTGLKSSNPELRRECAQALGRTRSPDAVAPLLTLLRQDKELREQAAYSLSELPRDEKTVAQLIQLLKAIRTRSAAARALSNLRENQDSAVRALVAAFTDSEQEDDREMLGHALQSLGKPAVTQLVALFEDATVKEETRLAAIAIVGHMREDARDVLPKLEKHLKDRNKLIRMRVAIALAYQNTDADVAELLLDAIETNDNRLRYDAQSALGALRTKGAKSVDRLIKWLKGADDDRRNIAISLLASVGRDSPKALSALIALLKSSEDQNLRRSATYSLHVFEERGAAELIKVLGDPSYSRPDVIAALRQLGPRAKSAGDPLAKCLGDTDRSVAIAAAIALAFIDPKNGAAVPVLIEGMRSPDREIRNQATSAMGNFGPLAKTAVPELIRALQTQDTRYSALNALARIGPDAAPAVDVLTRLLNSRDMYSAASALAAIGPAAAPAIPRLLRLLQNERTVVAAAVALGKIGGDAKQAIPLLVTKLSDNDQITSACQALANVGHLDIDQTLSALRKAASNPDPEIRAIVVSALGQLHSPKTVEDLLTALKDSELSVRIAAVGALGQLGSEAEPAVAKLAEVLEAKELALRENAAWALGNIGSKAETAVPALIKALSNKEMQSSAIYALGRIGKGAGAAVPQLVELLDAPKLRYGAAYALGQIGPAAKAALPKLRMLAKDRDPQFAKAAQTAVDRIEGKAAPSDDDPD